MGWCFRDSSLHDDIRRCAMSVGIRSRIARLAGLCGGSCAPNAMSHSVFPVQHHRHPSRSSAWFKAAQCAALELRDEEFASNFQSPFRCGALKVAFKQKLVPRVARHTPQENSSAKLCARPTGRGSVPAARFVAIRATRTLPLPWG